jgi:PAS domain-containing protein
MDLGAVMLDGAGRVLFINDQLLRTLGRGRDDVLGKDWIDTVVRAPDRAGIRAAFDEGLASGSLSGSREDSIATAWARHAGWHGRA